MRQMTLKEGKGSRSSPGTPFLGSVKPAMIAALRPARYLLWSLLLFILAPFRQTETKESCFCHFDILSGSSKLPFRQSAGAAIGDSYPKLNSLNDLSS